ncbi:MAG: Na/Pi symporter, partial [Thermoflexibacteraceae bacterium]
MATIVLFLFSLKGFSKELQAVGADTLNHWLGHITQNRLRGFLFGALITAVIQSSSAVSSITVALVDAQVITFFNSLSVLIGANVGTTFTAWLVAFKLDNLGSILIVAGTLMSAIPYRVNLAGKSIFYLGLILFSLQLISTTLKPMSQHEGFLYALSLADNIFIGILLGTLVTAVLQSSSVVTGL